MLAKKCFLMGMITLLSVSLAMADPPAVHPVTGEELVIDCFRGTPDAIDGDLSDWNLAAMTPAVLDVVEQLYSGQDSWTGPEDCSGEFYVLWDDVNIYMAVVVKDEKLSMNKTGGNIWNADAVEVFFATTNAVTGHAEHYQYGFNANSQKWNWCNMDGAGSIEPDYLQVASTLTADGYICEAAIPYAQMPSLDWSAGNTIGFHPVFDDTDDGDRELQMTWTGREAHDQSLGFGHMILLVDAVPEPVPANVVLRVDFNSNQDGGGDSTTAGDPSLSEAAHNQEGWSSYHANHEVIDEFATADYDGITVTPDWPNTTDNRVRQSIDRSSGNDINWDDAAGDLNLVTDWIGIDTRTGNGGNGDWDGTTGTPTYMTLALGGLAAGNYDWTSFHHDTEHCHGPFAVWLSTDGGVTFTQLDDGVMTDSTPGGNPDSGATEVGPDANTLSSTYRTSFSADGVNDVVLRFAPYSEGAVHRQIWGMNGFVLELDPTIVLLAEDFEGLPLGPSIDEGTIQGVAGENVWTDTPPEGWTIDESGIPGIGDPATDGVTEWAGWAFADKDWWVETAGDQDRSLFTLGVGTVAIADPDEWDDEPHAGKGRIQEDPYDTWLSTPAIDISGIAAGTVQLVFDSSWRPEFDDNYHQTASITASFDGGDPVELLLWESDEASPNYKPYATNETVIVDVGNPEGAASVVLTFGLFDAGNDWWWAIDNVKVTGLPAAPAADPTLAIYYSFDEVGAIVADQSGKGHDGVVVGDVSALVEGILAGAAQLANTGYLDLDGANFPPEDIPTSGLTLAAWTNIDGTSGQNAIFNARASDATWLIHPEIRPGNGDYRLTVRKYGGVTIGNINGGTPGYKQPEGTPVPNEWVHVAMTFSRADAQVILYVNGEVVAEAATTEDADMAGDWGLGARVGYNIDDARHYTGLMDEFYMFTRALSQDEIMGL